MRRLFARSEPHPRPEAGRLGRFGTDAERLLVGLSGPELTLDPATIWRACAWVRVAILASRLMPSIARAQRAAASARAASLSAVACSPL